MTTAVGLAAIARRCLPVVRVRVGVELRVMVRLRLRLRLRLRVLHLLRDPPRRDVVLLPKVLGHNQHAAHGLIEPVARHLVNNKVSKQGVRQ